MLWGCVSGLRIAACFSRCTISHSAEVWKDVLEKRIIGLPEILRNAVPLGCVTWVDSANHHTMPFELKAKRLTQASMAASMPNS